jgi:hypothetical protein
MKKLLLALISAGLLTCTAVSASAQTEKKEKKAKKADAGMAATSSAPKSVIHVVTVNFKPTATKEQIQAAIDGVKKLPSQYPGITHVWTRPIKNQTDKSHILIMEFASEQALKDYDGSDAQKEWYKSYLDIRDRSTTFDVTN